jgi:hypothetical protein
MIVYLKYLILICGFAAFGVLINGDEDQNNSFTGLGLIGASCFIAFALIENNDINEKNKD